MPKKRTKHFIRAFCRDDRCDGALGSVISMGMFIMLLVLFVWMILTYYSFRVLSSAANEGAAVAAQYDLATDGDPDVGLQQGQIYAEELIADAGARSLVENISTSSEVRDERATITVSGRAVTPLFSMNLSATGSAPIEEFRPQGEEFP